MLEYPELGMEAVWRIEVVDFPAFIVVDDKGNDFFEQVRRDADARADARLTLNRRRRPARRARVGGVRLDAEEDVGHDAVVVAGQLAGSAGGDRPSPVPSATSTSSISPSVHHGGYSKR